MTIHLHVGQVGSDGPDTPAVGSIGDRDLLATQSLARALGLEINLNPHYDFTISASEVARAAERLGEATQAVEANGADIKSRGIWDLCVALRRAADAGQGLSGFVD